MSKVITGKLVFCFENCSKNTERFLTIFEKDFLFFKLLLEVSKDQIQNAAGPLNRTQLVGALDVSMKAKHYRIGGKSWKHLVPIPQVKCCCQLKYVNPNN